VSFDWAIVPGATLASDLDAWVVQGRRGEVMVFYSVGFSDSGDASIFDALLKGVPPVLLPLARVPAAIAAETLTENVADVGPRDVDWDAVEGSTIDVAPTAWHVTLTSGQRIVVYAHRYRREGGEYLFTLPLQGGRIQLPIARISDHLVAEVAEGPALD
jgi:hypothetical protein